jgi:hypothetical protein
MPAKRRDSAARGETGEHALMPSDRQIKKCETPARRSRSGQTGAFMLELRIEHRPVNALVPYAGNARTHREAQVALVAGSNCTSGAKAR